MDFSVVIFCLFWLVVLYGSVYIIGLELVGTPSFF